MRKKLTDRGIKALSSDGTTDVFDKVLPGFGVRVGKRRKTFFCMYRLDGKLVRHSLGQFVPDTDRVWRAIQAARAGS